MGIREYDVSEITIVRGFHRPPVSSPHKGQWRGALMFSLICVWLDGWVNNGEAGDLRRHHAHYDVTVITQNYHITRGKPISQWQRSFRFKAASHLLRGLRQRQIAAVILATEWVCSKWYHYVNFAMRQSTASKGASRRPETPKTG